MRHASCWMTTALYLQAISLIWTLLRNGHELLGGSPIAKRCIICCPTSLVSNWESECKKWLQVRALQALSNLTISAILQYDISVRECDAAKS